MSDMVERLNAALEGRYAIERELGEGGMATVYLADDLKHERKVALKVLKPELAAVVGAERFLAEIKTTANLTHPHILPLFDSGEADGFLFYVMPYLEGETLRDRIDREKQLPVDEAVAFASKVAGALQHAHEHNVIHRDIKPGNILLQDGEPVVADFGIALAISAGGAGERLTETGLSLGTPHYMAPEQATGDQAVGASADTYALGSVLYEMLVGEPPYPGTTAQAVLGKIIAGKPVSATEHRPSVPANVDGAVRKALEKLPADRFKSAQEFVRALGDSAFTHGKPTIAGVVPSGETWKRTSYALAATTAFLSVIAAWGWLKPGVEPAPPTRSLLDLEGIQLQFENDRIIVSPDGSRFAVAGTRDGQRALFWRGAADESFRMIPGTEEAWDPAFSPEGDWIVYSDQGEAILKVSLSGGAPTPVTRGGELGQQGYLVPNWGDDGRIVFGGPAGMFWVPETGGEVTLLHDNSFRSPSFLPGGRGILGHRPGEGVLLLDLETDSVRVLISDGVQAKYLETGHLAYADVSGGLWVVEFDVKRGEVRGSAVLVLDGLTVLNQRRVRLSVSRNGTLVYEAGGGAAVPQRLLVVDLDGEAETLPLQPRIFSNIRWSPDGDRVVYGGTDPRQLGLEDIYLYNVTTGSGPTRFTFEGSNSSPVWAPDGTRIAFRSTRGGDPPGLYVKNVEGDAPPRLVTQLVDGRLPMQWPSENILLIEDQAATDLLILDLSSDSAAWRPYLRSGARLSNMSVSQDGGLAAYHQSNELGIRQVYVRSFPEGGQPTLISEGRGGFPFWSPEGDRVYYFTRPNLSLPVSAFIAAQIDRGPPLTVVSTDTLFYGQYNVPDWNLHPDGDRMVITQDDVGLSIAGASGGASSPERQVLITNFFEVLRRLVPN